ncbi:TIM-barrel domain-containing protein [Clostridium beijerinckii]|uniref:Alpha-D-xyloside xylohydrolase n=1 Tax=Clostridium beijerinckii TaxID=1520 RepID=A0A9Q5CZV6_CLOBE|nr:glycoside hydrolase family 31 protein [Clostridium beijerinckii]AQS05563.1 alpha-xylosidase BoGH31A precursor [Clostridium beijerinckii]MBA2884929.1 alpha-D-xyloside xylohydrolase [Clostridium beijerinckii]MBA2899697.1 alpha-D-xyloside xylohydrolase [Clostridium beijerinckii]MBA2909280.1 alpha-D-xyloside xylohydrolase [Clostridium beijerinckii]MBA9014853.1 alpha-D-xyloside xylohydrolase [Clostridium beijerinckii]
MGQFDDNREFLLGYFEEKDGALCYRYDAERLIIMPWGPNSLRIKSTKGPDMPMEDWALIEPKSSNAKISIEEYSAKIVNGKITAVINQIGKLEFYNQKGKLLLEEYVRNRKDMYSSTCSSLEVEGREFKPIIGGDYHLSMRFVSNPDEKIYGMGQYQQPFLDVKGADLELAHRNSQASVPFALSSLGYGFLWNNPAVGRVNFGKNITTWEAYSTKKLDYWITAGDTPAEIEEAYADATGKVPMMPKYAMGFWQCKLRYQTQEELLEVAREYKKRNLPISVIVVDFFHWPLQGEWKFDPTYWPDPDAMIKELKDMGIELMVSIWPTVDYRSENFDEMMNKGLLVRTDKGFRICMNFMGNTIHYDPTNPEAREYVWQKAKKNYYDKGVKIFWLDEAEPEYSVYDFENYRYHLGPNVQVGNIYPMMYAKTFFDGMKEEGQEGIINLLRCAWAGSQRYGALVWSGDIHSSFKSLRNQFAAGLNMGLAGIPWWTTDIGGFFGGHIDDPDFHEVLIRWFEYGTFCPVMRLHGYRWPFKPQYGTTGGAECVSGADNEVWSYGDKVYEICKKYLKIREAMMPYITTLMEEAHKKGTPVMRPMFYDFPEDKLCWENESQYMFGPNILVAPIMEKGQTEREVYLPAGSNWTNAWTKEEMEGGKTILVDAPIDQIPLFLRDYKEGSCTINI